jgi:hypothetical protein
MIYQSAGRRVLSFGQGMGAGEGKGIKRGVSPGAGSLLVGGRRATFYALCRK